MPNVTLTIEDHSPLAVYSSEWTPGPQEDQSLSRYSGSNYMTTKASGEFVTFVFTGTALQLFGAKRPGYGQYQITSTVGDKVEPYPLREASSSQDVFQTSLWSFAWPAVKTRTIKMENMGNNKAIDLDFISWTFPVGRDDEEIIVSTFEDSHPSFKFDSESNWVRNNSTTVASFSGGSARVASSVGSTLEFEFEGEAVSLYGSVGPGGSPYTVTLDTNGLPVEFTTRKPAFHPNTIIFHQAALGPGTHKLTLVVGDANSPANFTIDYAQVYTAPSLHESATPSSSALSNGAVAGIVAGGIVGLLLLLGLLFVLWARRTRKGKRPFHFGFINKRELDIDGGVEPYTYTDTSPPMTATSGDRLLQNQVSFSSFSSNPATAQLSPNGTLLTAATIQDSVRPVSVILPTTQEVIIPPRGFEKSSRAPQLQPAPQGTRGRQTPAAYGAAGQTVSPVQEETAQTQDPPPPVYKAVG